MSWSYPDSPALRSARAKQLFEQRDAHLGHLPEQILFDLARNEAASRDWRKAAVEIMLDKNFPKVNHPELAFFVQEIRQERAARQDVEAAVESAIEAPLPEASTPRASVTTASLQQPDVIRNAEKLADDALAEDYDGSITPEAASLD